MLQKPDKMWLWVSQCRLIYWRFWKHCWKLSWTHLLFCVFQHHTHPPGDPAETVQTPASVQMAKCSVPLGAPLLSLSHLRALSAAPLALLWLGPSPLSYSANKLRAVDRDRTAQHCAQNPVLQVTLRHFWARPYPEGFLWISIVTLELLTPVGPPGQWL